MCIYHPTKDRFDAVFDPDDGRYSGSLPLLTTSDTDIAKLYYAGVASALELERSTATLPHAPPGTSRAFVTGKLRETRLTTWSLALARSLSLCSATVSHAVMHARVGGGSNCSTNIFFWDTAYCATTLILLDPEMVRASLLHWMKVGAVNHPAASCVDSHSCPCDICANYHLRRSLLLACQYRDVYGQPALASEALGGWGVDLLSGRAVGNHYAADDFTLFKLSR